MARGERTPEERERARLERAAKRAAREGRPPPTELPSLEVPPPLPGEPDAPSPAARIERAEPAVPAAGEPPVANESPPADEPPARFEADAFLEEEPEPPAEPSDADPLPETADLPAVEPEPELFYDPLEDQADAPAPATPAPSEAPAEPRLPEAGEHPATRGEHAAEEDEAFDTGEYRSEEEVFETVEGEPFETGEHPVEGEPFDTGEHLVEDESFDTGEHPVEDEPFETGDHPAADPFPDDERPETRPLAALPAYPPISPEGAGGPHAAPRERARRIVDLNQATLTPEPPRRTRSRARYIVLGLLAVIVIAVAWLANSLYQPFKGDGSGRTAVQIPTGASVGQIADLLKSKGVISSSFFFEARATLAGRRDDFKAGRFTLANGMSNSAAMDAISKGPPPDVTRVVIPEGRARTQVRDLIGKRLRGNYLTLTRKSSALDPRRYGAPRTVANLEGFLFPDTYELKKSATTQSLVRDQLAQFKREFAKVNLAAAKRRKLTAYDVLIIASMIDQEAQVPRERRLVASVITNRLREGIPLGIDATTRYATNNRTRPLTRSELETNSPYNTRNRRGLPPGPIGSPGLAAIRAAANPARTSYLFYVVKPCGNGSHAFSRTNAEFERDAQRYNTARARRGGKSPTNC